MNAIKKLYKKLTSERISLDDSYLEQAESLSDVEFRLRQLQRGLAPHQRMFALRARMSL
jgi:hypothetical protein